MSQPGRQLADLFAYMLLPWSCLLLPRTWGEYLLRACAHRGWVLKARSASACASACKHVEITDRPAWQRRWRMLELVESRDMWFCLAGRSASVLSRVETSGPHPPAQGQVLLIGLHWGTSVLALAWLQRAGLQPRLVYRRVMPDMRREAPFQYFYLKAMVRFIKRVCGQAAIQVPGGKSDVDDALQAGSNLVILMDTPVVGKRRVREVRFLGETVKLHADGFDLVTGTGAPCVFFCMGLEDENGATKSLSFSTPMVEDDPAALAAVLSSQFDEYIQRDSAQWRLWHGAEQLFKQG
jgi:hypothetical protein